jgi:hypothetical protein
MDGLRVDPARYIERIQEKRALSHAWKLDPGLWDHIVWRSCTIRILLVCDGFLYFSDEDFGLSDLIGILKNEPFAFARFELSAAHRSNVSDARVGVGNPHLTRTIKSLRFDDAAKFDPTLYDQVWLFGSDRSSPSGGDWSPRLSDTELRALSQFMDGGGGVFATGDHEDLGCAMGGFLPRVRAMRRWFFPGLGPNGEGLAPPFEGAGRFDTNREGPSGGWQFNDQSDVVPQVIEPHYYKARVGVLREVSWPHPILCGPEGPITVLPDHPHESQCTAADTLDWAPTFDGYTITEFPAATDGGEQPIPEVIAWSRVIGGHPTSGKSGNTVARMFGAIAAYDGHRASVGRVVTDATWHHFININLTGEAGAAFPKSVGFLATAEGMAHYEDIQAYFRNIALWLSRPPKLKCMRNWSLLVAINSHRFKEIYDPRVTLESARLHDYIFVGRHARDAIGKYASQCQSWRWLIDIVLEEVRIKKWIDPGDPWVPRPEVERREVETVLEGLVPLEWLVEASLGGAVLALRDKLFPLEEKTFERVSDEAIDELVRAGSRAGLRVGARGLREGLKDVQDLFNPIEAGDER